MPYPAAARPAAPVGPLLHDIFVAAARRHPDRTAVEVPPGPARPQRASITYADLAADAAAIAARLSPLVTPDARVVILLPRDTVTLYAAQLGTLLAGAAHVCLDPAFPDPHLAAVIADAAPVAILTDAAGASRLPDVAAVEVVEVAAIDRMTSIPSTSPSTSPSTTPTDLAYLTYTSGTTGRPKGVMIEHRSIVHLVASDVTAFALTPDDRVAQCSSPAYDSSIEETWLAFASGATLVVLDDAAVRLGPDLVEWLARERITVLCPPPTLLRMMACDDPATALPALRLLYVGGEALPQDLADTWSRGRRMVNGYGPTECTVTVVRADVMPGQPVTIGRAIDGSEAHVLAADGELCISGISLARGYLGQDALTDERFPIHPHMGRIYRTGDRVRRMADGTLAYLGRIDAQVKLRGHRIELEAIDTHLAALPGVRAAASCVQGDGPAAVLVAHIVPERSDAPPEAVALAAALGAILPDHMVPRRFGFLSDLPTSVGGKLDRRALPPIEARPRVRAAGTARPGDWAERRVAQAFAAALDLAEDADRPVDGRAQPLIDPDDDFFTALGGTSLTAVAVILALRDDRAALPDDPPTSLAGIGVRDLYEAPTVARLAARLRSAAQAIPRSSSDPLVPFPRSAHSPHSALSPHVARPVRSLSAPRRMIAVQTVWLAVHLVAGSALAYASVLIVWPWLLQRVGLFGGFVLIPIALGGARLAALPLAIGWAALVKRTVIGRYVAGRHPVWGAFHTRHWIATHAARKVPWALIAGTAWTSAALRALGANVGRRVHVHRGVDLSCGGWDVLSLGDDVTLSQDAAARPVTFERGELVVDAVTLADGATLGVRAGVGPGAAIGRGGQLTALSFLASGAAVPPGERWDGVPAGPHDRSPAPPAISGGRAWSPGVHALLIVVGRALIPVLWLTPLFASAAVVLRTASWTGDDVAHWLTAPSDVAALAGATVVLTALGLVLGLTAQVGAMRAVGRVRPGTYDRLSAAAARAMFKTGVLASAGTWLSGSMLWRGWLRAAGMRIGPGGEVSTIIDTVPECTSIGADSFLADGIYLAGPHVDRGTFTVRDTSLGRDTFLGNHSVIAAGHRWPDALFVGVATAPDPAAIDPVASGGPAAGPNGVAWFGHPPFRLPRRAFVPSDRRLTHVPGPARWWTRAFWEALRFALPAWPTCVAIGWLAVVAHAAASLRPVPFGAVWLLGVFVPAATLAAAAVLVASVVVLKWALLGRVKPGQHAFWSCWCGRWDFFYMAWGIWAHGVLAPLEGTLWLNAVLRLFGMDIGKRVVLGPGFAHVVDPDMLHFGNDAIVLGQFQAHSFEDRILKIDHVRIGPGATIGDNAVVFYGATVGAGARLLPHGVVMKGDVLAAGGVYAGCPTKAVPRPAFANAAATDNP